MEIQGSQGVLEGAARILVGSLGMGEPRQMDQDLRLEVPQPVGEGTLVPGVLDIEGDVRRPQQVQPLVDDAQGQVAIGAVVIGRGEGEQVVDLQSVDDRNRRPALGQRKRQVVADEARPAHQRDSSSLKGDHVTSRPCHFTAATTSLTDAMR